VKVPFMKERREKAQKGFNWVNESVKGSCNVGRCGRYFSWKISLSPRDTGSLQ
jgi:hypothetical protein